MLKEKSSDEKLASLSKALGHPYRIKILKILAELPPNNNCMVSNLVEELPISQSTVSQHLKILKKAGWIKGKVEGPSVCYCLRPEAYRDYKEMLEKLFAK